MTKDEIITKWIRQTPILSLEECVDKAMGEWSEIKAIAFSEWMDINAVRNGEHEWVFKGDGFLINHTTEQLYKIFEDKNK